MQDLELLCCALWDAFSRGFLRSLLNCLALVPPPRKVLVLERAGWVPESISKVSSSVGTCRSSSFEPWLNLTGLAASGIVRDFSGVISWLSVARLLSLVCDSRCSLLGTNDVAVGFNVKPTLPGPLCNVERPPSTALGASAASYRHHCSMGLRKWTAGCLGGDRGRLTREGLSGSFFLAILHPPPTCHSSRPVAIHSSLGRQRASSSSTSSGCCQESSLPRWRSMSVRRRSAESAGFWGT